MTVLDPRFNAYRPDLADRALLGRVEAQRFVEGEAARIGRALAPLHRRPEAEAPLDTELLAGERVTVFERRDGWAWVRNETDGYVGYLEETALAAPGAPPTHVVTALRTPLFPAPDIKRPPREALPFLARVAVSRQEGRFLALEEGGFLFAGHLAPLGWREPDILASARRFLGVPYVWGGKSALGLDCSGLLQLVLQAAGLAAPRDSDQQETSPDLGAELPPDSAPQRGDLLFWRGHAGIALDEKRLLHATAHHLLVVEEEIAAVDRRARAESLQGLTRIRRLP